MNTIKLPLAVPPLKGFLSWAYTLSITGLHEETLPWYYCNFIQMSCSKKFLETQTECQYNFARGTPREMNSNNPFIKTCSFNYELYSHLDANGIMEMLIEQIKKGYYIALFVDESKISHCYNYYKIDFFPHHVLLSGFDLNERIFDVSMFRNGIYGTYATSFDELTHAISSMKMATAEDPNKDHHSHFLKYFHGTQYIFDKKAITNQLKDYLNSESNLNIINFNTTDEAYGLETYSALKQYFVALKEDNPNLVVRRGQRHFHLLLEHKNAMVNRIKYLIEKEIIPQDNDLVQGYQEQANKAESLRNLMVRRPVKETLDKVIASMDYFREQETVWMNRLLSYLER
ncbi:MAG: hypothetical protein JWM44_4387 [Bacilli bacterium]|nr:hypothetical protein [Bacilli bacterium]